MKLPWQREAPLKAAYADYDTVISDRRVEAIADILSKQFKALPDDTDLVTFIQPPTVVDRNGVGVPIPEVACFAVISDNPRHKGHRVMTQGSVWLRDWRATDAARLHFVSGPDDPALPIFKLLVRDHLPKLQNLRDML